MSIAEQPAFLDLDLEPALRRMRQWGLDDGDIGFAYWDAIANMLKAAQAMQIRTGKLEREIERLRRRRLADLKNPN